MQERGDLGTKPFTLIKFLTLKKENTSLIFRLLQYVLTNARSLLCIYINVYIHIYVYIYILYIDICIYKYNCITLAY